MRRSSSPLQAGCLLLVLGAAPLAKAQGGDSVLAETLFRDAKALMGQKNYAEACPKLEESQRLDPGGGTLGMLAECYEGMGRTASAWGAYTELLTLGRQRGRADVVSFAENKIAELEKRLIRLKLEVTSPVDGIELRRDGRPLPRAAWSTAIPVDPGLHTVEASAPGHKTWRASLAASEAERSPRLVVPPLDPAPAPPPEASSASPALPPPPTPVAPVAPAPPPLARPIPLSAYVSGGVGAAGLLLGAYFGIRTLSKADEARTKCATADCTDASGVDAGKDAHRSARLSDVGFGVGALGLGLATYFILTRPAVADTQSVWLSPGGSRAGASLTLGASW